MPLRRPIFLSGMMATGKSTLGRVVAERAQVPFVDLDREIEEAAGTSIRRIFEDRGEASFRAMERDALARQFSDPTPRVIALGGGALVPRASRLAALERGIVITLSAPPSELARRLAAHEDRPLLGGADFSGHSESRLREILEARASGYAEAHAVLDTAGRAAEELASEVLRIAALDPIAVPLGERTYAVDVVPEGARAHLESALDQLTPSRLVTVTDENVDRLAMPKLGGVLERSDTVKIVLPPGEGHKTLASLERILGAAVLAPVDRKAVVVGVGGGVVTDIAGLAAALTLRGLRWIAVPTTVLAMVDASVGGKTAVDYQAAKNAIGAFHQPSRVIVDPALSQTETLRAFRNGLAEVLKTAILGDAPLYRELNDTDAAERLARDREPEATARAIRSSITVKARIVGRDERESGERAHLNLGHTIGHALEAEGGFERLMHGEAVALGLVAALRIGAALGVTPRPLVAEITRLIVRLGLPADLDAEPLEKALRWVSYDKKREAGSPRFVLVREPGSVEVVPIKMSEIPRLLAAR